MKNQMILNHQSGAWPAAWVRPALMAGVSLTLAMPAAAQTFTTLHSFTAGSGSIPLGGGGQGTVFSLSFAPQLTITPAGANMLLSWPLSYAGFSYAGYAVQDTSDLLSPTSWSVPDPFPPVIVNGQFQITRPMVGPNRSYRLKLVR